MNVTVLDCRDGAVDELSRMIAPYIQVQEGDCIFIKPNLVIDPWKGEEEAWPAAVTDPNLIEATIRCITQKVKRCTIMVGDAPMARTKIDTILEKMDLPGRIARYQSPDHPIELIDIRRFYWKHVADMCVSRRELPGDPRGTLRVALDGESAFKDKAKADFAMEDTTEPITDYHNGGKHAYEVSQSALECDLFINLPKLKTHRLAGITCAMKNLVGIVANKNCVPHRTDGASAEGGDAYPSNETNVINADKGLRSVVRKIIRYKNPAINYCLVPVKIVHDKLIGKKLRTMKGYGAWYGNDTIWRSVVDLNRIILYADRDGVLQDTRQRRYLCIADALVAGQGEGPLHPTPKPCGKLFISENPFALDMAAARYMGFDEQKIHYLRETPHMDRYPLICDRGEITIERGGVRCPLEQWHEVERFKPAAGWAGHIERDEE